MTVEEMAEVIGRAHGDALDDVSRALWAAHAAGQVTDDEAESLSVVIEARRGTSHAARVAMGESLRSEEPPQETPSFRPPSVRRPPCPKRAEARERSRRWAAAGRMPPAIAAKFTSGEQAALAVVAFEITKRQFCDKSLKEIGDVAGVSESTVKRAIRHARALGLLTVQERRLSRYRSDTNIVRIISKEWVSWLELRGCRSGGQRRPGTNTVLDLTQRKPEGRRGKGLPEGGEMQAGFTSKAVERPIESFEGRGSATSRSPFTARQGSSLYPNAV